MLSTSLTPPPPVKTVPLESTEMLFNPLLPLRYREVQLAPVMSSTRITAGA